MKLFRKTQKGIPGYIKTEQIRILILTILLFILPLGLYIIGLVVTGTNKNLMTLFAVLGCLPASMSLVQFIMFQLAEPCDKEDQKAIQAVTQEGYFDYCFTGGEKTYQIGHLFYRKGNLILYPSKDLEADKLEKHLQKYLAQAQIKDVTVHTIQNRQTYLNRIKELSKLEQDKAKEETILTLLNHISL